MNLSLTTFTLQTVVLAAAIFACLALLPNSASAITPIVGQSLSGWAWSSTIGWISFSCSDTSSCLADGGHDYDVSINSGGSLVGWAWSPNIGWIKFGSLNTSQMPAGPGTNNINARVSGTGPYQLTGWARACAGALNANCTGGLNPLSGGWDGWISFSGTGYSVDFTNTGVDTSGSNHWAWGSTVVGWIDMSGVNISSSIPTTAFFFDAQPRSVPVGATTELQWNVTGYSSGECVASSVDPAGNPLAHWDEVLADPLLTGDQTRTVTPPLGNTTYTLTCDTDSYSVVVSAISSVQNIAIDNVQRSGSIPAPNASGRYDNIAIRTTYGQFPVWSNVPYSVEVLNTTLSETVTDTDSVTRTSGSGSFTDTKSVSNLGFGYHEATVEIDLPAPGVVNEDDPGTPAIDEDVVDNTRTSGQFFLPPPAPTLTITPQDKAIRQGESTDITVAINSDVQVSCTLRGPGVNQSFGVSSGNAATAYNGTIVNTSVPVGPLNSTAEYVLDCIEPLTGHGGPTEPGWSDITLVEVVPVYQEV